MAVSFSTRAPNSDYLDFEASPEAMVAAAKKAEEVGFDAIFVNDHTVVGDDARSAPWTNVYDPFVTMSFIAAHSDFASAAFAPSRSQQRFFGIPATDIDIISAQHFWTGGLETAGPGCHDAVAIARAAGFPNAGYEPHPSCGDCRPSGPEAT
jgi:hypothetical protein